MEQGEIVNLFAPSIPQYVDEPGGLRDFAKKCGVVPQKYFDDIQIPVVRNCESAADRSVSSRRAELWQVLGGKTQITATLRSYARRGPLRYMPEIQMILPLACCRIPGYTKSVSVDFLEPLQTYKPPAVAAEETHGIFAAKCWSDNLSRNACVDVKSRRNSSVKDGLMSFSGELAVAKYAAETLNLGPAIVYCWAIETSSPDDKTALDFEKPIRKPFVTTFISYERFDWTLAGYVRQQIHNYLSNVQPDGRVFQVYVEDMIDRLSALFMDMLGYDAKPAYMAVPSAANYVLYRHAEAGIPFKMRLVGWEPKNLIDGTTMRVELSTLQGDSFLPNSPHMVLDRGATFIFKKTLAKVNYQYNAVPRINLYALQLFRNQMLAEISDVLEIERNELLRNIYSDSSDIELMRVEKYDETAAYVNKLKEDELETQKLIILEQFRGI